MEGEANGNGSHDWRGTPGKQAEDEGGADCREGMQFAIALDPKRGPPRMQVPAKWRAVRRPVKGVRPPDRQVTRVPYIREVVIAVHQDTTDKQSGNGSRCPPSGP